MEEKKESRSGMEIMNLLQVIDDYGSIFANAYMELVVMLSNCQFP